jgi:hypothetical protein
MDSFTRLVNALHYVIYYANNNNLKLNASLLINTVFFAEIVCLDTIWRPLTGVKMVKAPFGPVPDGHEEAIKYLVKDGKIEVINTSNEIFYVNISVPDTSMFDNEQLNILGLLANNICIQYSAALLSKLTRQNRVWELLELGEEIPIIAYLDHEFEIITQDEFEILKKEAESFAIPHEW